MASVGDTKIEAARRPTPEEGCCHFYVDRKRRYCRFKSSPGIQYCAEHASASGAATARKRINCPYDTKHTCYADRLDHHMKRCPSKPREMPPYHVKGINSGDDGGEMVPDPKVTVLTVSPEEVVAMIDKVNQLYEEYVGDLEESILTHDCLRGELDNTSYGPAAMRHRKQQASLIGHMERQGLLADGMCYVEMGAGKGHLSHWLHAAVSDKQDIGFLLVDRSHVRNKVDNLHKEEGAGHVMCRIRMDIEDLRLGKVPTIEQNNRPVVAYGKHLCGAATDLALRCVMETVTDNATEPTDDAGCEPRSEPRRKRLKSGQSSAAGTVIALCCHHRCTWQPYVGKPFFRSCGLTARHFQLLSSMTSWATCAWKGWSHSRKQGQMSNVRDDKGQHDPGTETGEKQQFVEVDSEGHGLIQGQPDSKTEMDDKSITSKVTKDFEGQEEETSVVNTVQMLLEAADESKTQIKSDNLLGTGDNGKFTSPDKRSLEGERSSGDGPTTTTTTGSDLIDEDGEHDVADVLTNHGINDKYSESEREEIGRKCKRLIDYGRVKYLQDRGLHTSLQVYIDEFYTPENVALVATA